MKGYLNGKKAMVVMFAAFLAAGQAATGVFAANAPSANAKEWEVLKQVNQERIKEGRDPLTVSTNMQTAAHVRAKEIVTLFSHMRPNGTSCASVLDQCHIKWDFMGENIALGQSTPSEVMAAWMKSKRHKVNILASDYSHIGIGVTGVRWVQLFTGECKPKSASVTGGTKVVSRGKTIQSMKRMLRIRCSEHGYSYLPISGSMCSGYNSKKYGIQQVTVKYKNLKAKFSVVVSKVTNAVTISKVKSSKKKLKVTWKKVKGSEGYQVLYSTSRSFRSAKKMHTTKFSYSKKLKKGKRYYVKVRTYVKSNKGKVYGPYSKTKSVKIK